MAELSERSGVAVPSIKFYLREQLLAAGERTSPNQSSYSEAHVDRLKLIRALIDVGGLSVSAAKGVLAAIDDDRMPLSWAFGVAQRAIPRGMPESVSPEQHGTAAVEEVIESMGWRVSAENPGRAMAAAVIDSFHRVGHDELAVMMPRYAEAAAIVAGADLDSLELQGDRATMAETVVVGTVLGDALFAGLRRIAQEHLSEQRYPSEPPPGTAPDCEPADPAAPPDPNGAQQ